MFCCVRGTDEDMPTGPKRLKMVIVGDGDCGKTCLLYRFAYEEFFTRYIPTVFEVDCKTVYYKDEEVQLLMYDTAGQEDYDRLRPFSYDDTDVMVICYSIDDPDSLDNVLLNWLPEVRYFCGNIPVLLVGNKKDLRCPAVAHDTQLLHMAPMIETAADGGSVEELKEVSLTHTVTKGDTVKYADGLAVANKMGAVAYFETSAKTGDGTDAVFEAVIRAGMEATVKKSKRSFFRRGRKTP